MIADLAVDIIGGVIELLSADWPTGRRRHRPVYRKWRSARTDEWMSGSLVLKRHKAKWIAEDYDESFVFKSVGSQSELVGEDRECFGDSFVMLAVVTSSGREGLVVKRELAQRLQDKLS